MRELYEAMQCLVDLHVDLVEISQNKTEEIKQGDMEKLSKLLMQERKQVQLISQKESERQELVEKFFVEKNAENEEQTMTNLLAFIDDETEKVEFEKVMSALIDAIVELREIEQLNKELMEQSMQLVQLSLDMLQPSINRMNYDGKQNIQESSKRSVFDSKA